MSLGESVVMGVAGTAPAYSAEALEATGEWAPDFVILDVHMPKINGYEVARRLRARFSPAAMRLVMMSGDQFDETVTACARQAGFDQCIDKTLAVKELAALLRGEAPSPG